MLSVYLLIAFYFGGVVSHILGYLRSYVIVDIRKHLAGQNFWVQLHWWGLVLWDGLLWVVGGWKG